MNGKNDKYDGAALYTADDEPKGLSHEDVIDALGEYLDNQAERNEPLAETIKRLAPIEVNAYDRVKIEDAGWQLLASAAAEAVGDVWCDMPEISGGNLKTWTDTRIKELAAAFEPLIREHAPKLYHCEHVGSREYSEAELLEMFAEEVKRS